MEHEFSFLITDLDGTAIANRENALPSQRLIDAVRAAQEHIPVSVATGRPISNGRDIIRALGIKSPCIISGGSQIIDPQTEETLWEQRLDETQVNAVVEKCKPYDFVLLFGDELLSDPNAVSAKDKVVTGSERVIFLMGVKDGELESVMAEIKAVNDVVAHAVPSWAEGQRDVHVTHIGATKEQALKVLFEMLRVQKEKAVAIGDSNNDLPLFRGVGYKVAMGNATEELRAEADYITASVAEDGLAQFIEQKILHQIK